MRLAVGNLLVIVWLDLVIDLVLVCFGEMRRFSLGFSWDFGELLLFLLACWCL